MVSSYSTVEKTRSTGEPPGTVCDNPSGTDDTRVDVTKATNALKVLGSYASGIHLPTAPLLIDIEPTNRCDMVCRICPNPGMVREQGRMDPALFRSIVDQTVDTALQHHINLHGEPTLHPDLVEMLSYAVSRGASVTLYTNLGHENDALLDGLVDSGLEQVVVNICGIDEDTYSHIHGVERLDTVLENLTRLRARRKEKGASLPRVVTSYVVTKANLHQASRASEVLEEYSDYCALKVQHDWLGDPEIAATLPGEGGSVTPLKCSRPWTTASILWDGRIATCCYDHEGRTILGDLSSASLDEIWNSQDMRRFRKRYREHDPCRDCVERDHQFSLKNLYYLMRASLSGRG